jgi:hypothetical protein
MFLIMIGVAAFGWPLIIGLNRGQGWYGFGLSLATLAIYVIVSAFATSLAGLACAIAFEVWRCAACDDARQPTKALELPPRSIHQRG